MPYYLHKTEIKGDSDAIVREGKPFTFRESAVIASNFGEFITYIANEEERDNWHARERSRFDSGEYTAVPWSSYTYPNHFPHQSLALPGLIAYTANDEHGLNDRQTRVKPGRYLELFYGPDTSDDWAKSYRDGLIALCQAFSGAKLQFATSADDIERIYVGGPSSCMSGKIGNGNYHGDYRGQKTCEQHPVRAYGESDLAIAYTGDIDAVTGRCVVWPEKKIWSLKQDGRTSIVGNVETMTALLKAMGYAPGSTAGARIRALYDQDGWLTPYIDSCSYGQLSEDEKWIELLEGGSHDGRPNCIDIQNVRGCTDPYPEDDDEEDTRDCAHCGTSISMDDTYCSSCDDLRYICEDCCDDFFDNDQTTIYTGCYGSHDLCESCASEREVGCAAPDCDASWVEQAEFSYTVQRQRVDDHTDTLCVDCADRYYVCDCDTVRLQSERDEPCSECPTPRCQYTAPLPLDAVDDTPVAFVPNPDPNAPCWFVYVGLRGDTPLSGETVWYWDGSRSWHFHYQASGQPPLHTSNFTPSVMRGMRDCYVEIANPFPITPVSTEVVQCAIS